MRREELFFVLPDELIAQEPTLPRDHCRLMTIDRGTKAITNRHFYDLVALLTSGDVLVFNQSRVLPARLLGRKNSGGQVEIVLLRDLGKGEWTCLVGGKVHDAQALVFTNEHSATLLGTVFKPDDKDESCRIRFNKNGKELNDLIQQLGVMPTPPYIKSLLHDQTLYQTVYAKDIGSAAAPTAGLHFTEALIQKLRLQGVQMEFLTLHVGLGTFQPVKADDLSNHRMHSEWFSIAAEAWQRIRSAKKEGRRIIAVGTTSVRVLETLADDRRMASLDHGANDLTGETDIFIQPGYDFRCVDGLITNFHTPYSTLLALVYAFGGTELLRSAYDQAVKERYRFFSFGDAMFIS